MLINVYWICMLLGFIWLVIQLLLADFGSDFGDIDLDPGALDIDIDGAHVDSAEVLGAGEIHLSPVSPMVISGFITIFGATGIITQHVASEIPTIFTALIAIGIGFLGAAILWITLSAIIKTVSGSSEAKVADLIGHEAEVITPIRVGSVGEIAYIYNGSRYNAPARCIDNSDVERNHLVKIVRIVGTTYFVTALTQEELHGEKPEE